MIADIMVTTQITLMLSVVTIHENRQLSHDINVVDSVMVS